MLDKDNTEKQYGQGDATFIAAGKEEGVRRIVDTFFRNMQENPAYERIWNWHPDNHEMTQDKLSLFLFAWMGGPRLFKEKYGPINIPQAHAHLNIKLEERDMWLNCMQETLESLNYPSDLVEYLMKQFFIPAERIRQVCS